MSLIYIGMDTDKFEKGFLVLYCTRLQERIAELEVGIRRLIDVSTLKSQEKAMVELDELIKEQGE